MKDTTAYMISYMLKKVTSSRVKVKGSEISTKTGTSSYDSAKLKSLGLSTNVIQDAWTMTFSKNYSVAIWYGYDKLTKKLITLHLMHGVRELKSRQRLLIKLWKKC